jgi:hypothetical protein
LRRESLFREVNDGLRSLHEAVDGSGDGEFACECAHECSNVVELPLSEYAAVREHRTRFIVVGGDEDQRIERVVGRHKGYTVVEKPITP